MKSKNNLLYIILIVLLPIYSCTKWGCGSDPLFPEQYKLNQSYTDFITYDGSEKIVFTSNDSNHDTLRFNSKESIMQLNYVLDGKGTGLLDCGTYPVYCENRFYKYICIEDPSFQFSFGIKNGFVSDGAYYDTKNSDYIYLELDIQNTKTEVNRICEPNVFFPPKGTTKTFNNGKVFNNTFNFLLENYPYDPLASKYYFNTEFGILNIVYNNVDYVFERFE